MLLLRSIPLILSDDPEIRATIAAFTAVKNAASAFAFNEGGRPLRAVPLHRACYKHISGRVGSQMTCSAIRLVAAAYTGARKNKHPITGVFRFKHQSALWLAGKPGKDASFLRNGKLSLLTVAGRKKVDFRIPASFQAQFDSAVELNSITVSLKNGKLCARLTLTLDIPTPVGYRPVGVDLNETNAVVACDSTGRTFFASGKKIKERNRRSRLTRKRLVARLNSRKAQKLGTRSVRRALKRLSGKQRNRSTTFAHTVAKQLCRWAPSGSVLVLEELKGIGHGVSKKRQRETGKWKSGALRRRLSAWNHAQIRMFVEQKAPMFGHETQLISPAYTSVTCNECGRLGERRRHSFVCACGNRAHADVNAAKNIRDRYVVGRLAPPRNGLSGSAVGAPTLSTSPEARGAQALSGKPLASCEG